MIEANVFVENSSTADVNNAVALILTIYGWGHETIVDVRPKAGGVEMHVQFRKMLDYEIFLDDLREIMGERVTTFMY